MSFPEYPKKLGPDVWKDEKNLPIIVRGKGTGINAKLKAAEDAYGKVDHKKLAPQPPYKTIAELEKATVACKTELDKVVAVRKEVKALLDLAKSKATDFKKALPDLKNDKGATAKTDKAIDQAEAIVKEAGALIGKLVKFDPLADFAAQRKEMDAHYAIVAKLMKQKLRDALKKIEVEIGVVEKTPAPKAYDDKVVKTVTDFAAVVPSTPALKPVANWWERTAKKKGDDFSDEKALKMQLADLKVLIAKSAKLLS
jgi:hypothetical protein